MVKLPGITSCAMTSHNSFSEKSILKAEGCHYICFLQKHSLLCDPEKTRAAHTAITLLGFSEHW